MRLKACARSAFTTADSTSPRASAIQPLTSEPSSSSRPVAPSRTFPSSRSASSCGCIPLARPVVLVDALRLEPVGPGGVAVTLGEHAGLRVELGRAPQVAEVRLHAPEVEVAPDALGRARADGDLDASLEVDQPLAVASGRPGDTDGVQRVRTKLVELQLLGDLHRRTRELDRRLGIVSRDLEPRQRAERVGLRVRRRTAFEPFDSRVHSLERLLAPAAAPEQLADDDVAFGGAIDVTRGEERVARGFQHALVRGSAPRERLAEAEEHERPLGGVPRQEVERAVEEARSSRERAQ